MKLIATVVDAEFAENISKIVIILFTNFLNRTMSFYRKTRKIISFVFRKIQHGVKGRK